MTSSPTRVLVHRIAIALAFLEQGLVFVSLTTKMPDLQRKFDLHPATFSLLLLGLVLCAGIGSLAGEKLTPKHGSAVTLRLGFALVTIMLPGMALASSVTTLALAMAGYGLALGLVDAGTNMQGVALEHHVGRTIMPTFHAAWTLGAILATGGAFATHNVSFEVSVFMLALVPLALVFAPFVHGGAPVVPIGDNGEPVPWKRIIPVGLALLLFYMVDTAVTTWGPTFLDHVFHAGPELVALAALPYLAASLVGRGLGDNLASRFGAASLISLASVGGPAGLTVVVFSTNSAMAMVGFLLVGICIAVVAPLSFSAAAAIARDTVTHDDPSAVRAKVDAIIARLNQFNYLGAILGAVLTGAVGNNTLRIGFAIPMVLVLLLAPLARAFRSVR